MKFGKLVVDNFLTIGHAEISLSDRGLLLVQGVNDDDSSASSNGAGKSSVVDALCWALFGATARGESGDCVVNRTAGKGCVVSIQVLEDDGSTYTVTRYRKHKTGKNAVTLHHLDVGGRPTETDLTQGTDKLTQAKIDEVIGCTHEVFCATVYAGQDQMPDLPGMTDKQLKMLVEEAAGVTMLEAAYEEARSRLNVVKTDLVTARAAVDVAENNVASARDTVGLLRTNALDWERQRKADVEELSGRAIVLHDKAKELKQAFEAYDVPKLEDGLNKVAAKLASVEGERKREKELIAEVSISERTLTALRVNLDRLKKLYEKQKQDVLDTDRLVGQPCGECGKAYCEHDLADAKKLATKKALETRDEFNTTKTQAVAAQKALESVTETLAQHRASMTDISAQTSLSDALNAKLRQAATARAEWQAGEKELVRVSDLHAKRGGEKNPFEAQIIAADKRVEAAENAKVDVNLRVAELEQKLEVAELVAKVFSPAGVRAHILDDVTPFLNEQTAKYLGTLSDGNITATWTTLVKNAKGELKEKFSIEVDHAEGGDRFGLISGGEKRKVRIATALALQDLVARRATKPLDLWIGDEIDNALDEPGLERLTAILEEKAKERGTVLVISHSDIRDWVPQVVTVTKKGKVSTLTEASV